MGRTFSNYYTYDEELYRNATCYGSNKQELLKLSDDLKKAILTDLTDRQAELVQMYYFDNLTIPEIARRLNLNKSTVSRGLKSARIRLRNVLKYSKKTLH